MRKPVWPNSKRRRRKPSGSARAAEAASQTAQTERNEAQRQRGEAQRQRDEAKEARKRESQATREVRRKLAEESFSRGSALCDQREVARGILLLARALSDLPADEVELQKAFRLKLSTWLARIYVCRLEIEHPGTVLSLAVAGNGRRVLTGSDDRKARLWDTEKGSLVGEPMGHRDKVTAVAFQPQGKVVATGSADGTARLWEAASGRPLSRPIEHRVGITAVAFSPNGTMLLTAGGHTVQKWEVASRKPVGQRLEHPAEVQTAVFSPDGKDDHHQLQGRGQRSAILGCGYRQDPGKTLGTKWRVVGGGGLLQVGKNHYRGCGRPSPTVELDNKATDRATAQASWLDLGSGA